MVCLLPTGLQRLHLSNGTINFGLGFTPIKSVGQLSAIRLTRMRLIAVPGIDYQLATVPVHMSASLMQVSCPNITLVLEACTFEAALNSPALDKVLACAGQEGAHVSLQPQTHQCHLWASHRNDYPPSSCPHFEPALWHTFLSTGDHDQVQVHRVQVCCACPERSPGHDARLLHGLAFITSC
jgi:hypothetical protein